MPIAPLPLPSECPHYQRELFHRRLKSEFNDQFEGVLRDALADVVNDVLFSATVEGEQLRRLYKAMAAEEGYQIKPCPDCQDDTCVKAAGIDPQKGPMLECGFCGRQFAPAESDAVFQSSHGVPEDALTTKSLDHRGLPSDATIRAWDREAAEARRNRDLSQLGAKFTDPL